MEFLIDSPTQTQLKRLKELVLQHRAILTSNADDEPLKDRLWSIISEELNCMEGGTILEPREWKSFINLEEYRSRRGRKCFKKSSDHTELAANMRQLGERNKRMKLEEPNNKPSTINQNYYHTDHGAITELKIEEDDTLNDEELNGLDSNDDSLEADDLESLLNSIDSDDSLDANEDQLDELANAKNLLNVKAQLKATPPLVKDFKYTKRMFATVEQLNLDVNMIKDQMKSTANTLSNIERLLQKQVEQQAETNAIMKRNAQLTKILVEYKIGRRSKNPTK